MKEIGHRVASSTVVPLPRGRIVSGLRGLKFYTVVNEHGVQQPRFWGNRCIRWNDVTGIAVDDAWGVTVMAARRMARLTDAQADQALHLLRAYLSVQAGQELPWFGGARLKSQQRPQWGAVRGQASLARSSR
jgi:hypothetical protein